MRSWPAFEGGSGKGVFAFVAHVSEDREEPFIRLPYVPWPNGGIVLWGDGTKTDVAPTATEASFSHVYSEAGDYSVYMVGIAGQIKRPINSFPKRFLTPLPETVSITPYETAGWFYLQDELESIIPGFFDKADITVKSDIRNLFSGCYNLTEIPEGLFAPFEGKIIYADRAFMDCGRDANRPLTIPADLLKDCTKLRSAASLFSNANVEVIPESLLQDCYALRDANGMFSSQVNWVDGIREIPADLLVNCPDLMNVNSMFRYLRNLTSIPSGLFRNNPNITDFRNTFADCTALTYAPELWDLYPNARGDNCFLRCTNASNYDQIPSDWK